MILCLAACRKSAPAAAEGAAPPREPGSSPKAARFCDEDLSGVWLNSSDRHYAYRFRDHGEVIRGEFQERSDDGALKNPDEPITFELHRTAGALAGVMRTTQQTRGGHQCPVEFGVDVTRCGPQSLQAVVELESPITDLCERRKAEDGGELLTRRTEYVFIRDPGPAPHPSGGGGRPDAH